MQQTCVRLRLLSQLQQALRQGRLELHLLAVKEVWQTELLLLRLRNMRSHLRLKIAFDRCRFPVQHVYCAKRLTRRPWCLKHPILTNFSSIAQTSDLQGRQATWLVERGRPSRVCLALRSRLLLTLHVYGVISL